MREGGIYFKVRIVRTLRPDDETTQYTTSREPPLPVTSRLSALPLHSARNIFRKLFARAELRSYFERRPYAYPYSQAYRVPTYRVDGRSIMIVVYPSFEVFKDSVVTVRVCICGTGLGP